MDRFKSDAPTSDLLLERMGKLHPKLIDLTLGRTQRLLAQLGNPQNRLGRVIHVAGTNGKGSTIAFMAAIAKAMGLRVNTYTSPHLVRFHERINLDGTPIAEELLAQILDQCLTANGPDPITYFEITTCAAFHAFAESPADLTLIEVGLGGRYDATNVIDRPTATVITPVSMDHQHFLGNTLEAIAGEKAGIIKRNVPCVVGPQQDAALAVIEREASKARAPLIVFGQEFHADEDQGRFALQHEDGLYDLPLPALPGAHQIENAATAIMALNAAGIAPTEHQIADGLTQAQWPGRLQDLKTHPFAKQLPVGSTLTLDGGHNVAAAEALAAHLASTTDPRPLWLICGMMQTKDNQGFLQQLKPHIADMVTVPIASGPTGPGLTAKALAEQARQIDLNATPAPDARTAMNLLPQTAPLRVLICGSLYLAGEVLALDN
ncbi:MAG: bifunctional folylpolyglutamate synthase/dihydrofolate synthase [Alphaproteobacteria bacterium]